MFFFVWRGWGPLAAVMLAPSLAACIGLIDSHVMLAFFCSGTLLVLGGVVCLYYGRKWNRVSGEHSMYGLPLEYWGWIYILFGCFNTTAAILGSIRRLVLSEQLT